MHSTDYALVPEVILHYLVVNKYIVNAFVVRSLSTCIITDFTKAVEAVLPWEMQCVEFKLTIVTKKEE